MAFKTTNAHLKRSHKCTLIEPDFSDIHRVSQRVLNDVPYSSHCVLNDVPYSSLKKDSHPVFHYVDSFIPNPNYIEGFHSDEFIKLKTCTDQDPECTNDFIKRDNNIKGSQQLPPKHDATSGSDCLIQCKDYYSKKVKRKFPSQRVVVKSNEILSKDSDKPEATYKPINQWKECSHKPKNAQEMTCPTEISDTVSVHFIQKETLLPEETQRLCQNIKEKTESESSPAVKKFVSRIESAENLPTSWKEAEKQSREIHGPMVSTGKNENSAEVTSSEGWTTKMQVLPDKPGVPAKKKTKRFAVDDSNSGADYVPPKKIRSYDKEAVRKYLLEKKAKKAKELKEKKMKEKEEKALREERLRDLVSKSKELAKTSFKKKQDRSTHPQNLEASEAPKAEVSFVCRCSHIKSSESGDDSSSVTLGPPSKGDLHNDDASSASVTSDDLKQLSRRHRGKLKKIKYLSNSETVENLVRHTIKECEELIGTSSTSLDTLLSNTSDSEVSTHRSEDTVGSIVNLSQKGKELGAAAKHLTSRILQEERRFDSNLFLRRTDNTVTLDAEKDKPSKLDESEKSVTSTDIDVSHNLDSATKIAESVDLRKNAIHQNYPLSCKDVEHCSVEELISRMTAALERHTCKKKVEVPLIQPTEKNEMSLVQTTVLPVKSKSGSVNQTSIYASVKKDDILSVVRHEPRSHQQNELQSNEKQSVDAYSDTKHAEDSLTLLQDEKFTNDFNVSLHPVRHSKLSGAFSHRESSDTEDPQKDEKACTKQEPKNSLTKGNACQTVNKTLPAWVRPLRNLMETGDTKAFLESESEFIPSEIKALTLASSAQCQKSTYQDSSGVTIPSSLSKHHNKTVTQQTMHLQQDKSCQMPSLKSSKTEGNSKACAIYNSDDFVELKPVKLKHNHSFPKKYLISEADGKMRRKQVIDRPPSPILPSPATVNSSLSSEVSFADKSPEVTSSKVKSSRVSSDEAKENFTSRDIPSSSLASVTFEEGKLDSSPQPPADGGSIKNSSSSLQSDQSYASERNRPLLQPSDLLSGRGPHYAPANLKLRVSAELMYQDTLGSALNHLRELEHLQEMANLRHDALALSEIYRNQDQHLEGDANIGPPTDASIELCTQQLRNSLKNVEAVEKEARERLAKLEDDIRSKAERTLDSVQRVSRENYQPDIISAAATAAVSATICQWENLKPRRVRHGIYSTQMKSGTRSHAEYSFPTRKSNAVTAVTSVSSSKVTGSISVSTGHALVPEEEESQKTREISVSVNEKDSLTLNALAKSETVSQEISSHVASEGNFASDNNISQAEVIGTSSLKEEISVASASVSTSSPVSISEALSDKESAIQLDSVTENISVTNSYSPSYNQRASVCTSVSGVNKELLSNDVVEESSKELTEPAKAILSHQTQVPSESEKYSDTFPTYSSSVKTSIQTSEHSSLTAHRFKPVVVPSESSSKIPALFPLRQADSEFKICSTSATVDEVALITPLKVSHSPLESRIYSTLGNLDHITSASVGSGVLGVTLGIMDMLQREEAIRNAHHKALLKLQEKSLIEEARWKLSSIQEEGGSNVKKRQRAVLLQLKEQRTYLRRLIEAQNVAAQQRRLLLLQHQHLLATTSNRVGSSRGHSSPSSPAFSSRLLDLSCSSSSDTTQEDTSLHSVLKEVSSNSNSERETRRSYLEERRRNSPKSMEKIKKLATEEGGIIPMNKGGNDMDKEKLRKKEEKISRRREKHERSPSCASALQEKVFHDKSISTESSLPEESIDGSTNESRSSVPEEVGSDAVTHSDEGHGTSEAANSSGSATSGTVETEKNNDLTRRSDSPVRPAEGSDTKSVCTRVVLKSVTIQDKPDHSGFSTSVENRRHSASSEPTNEHFSSTSSLNEDQEDSNVESSDVGLGESSDFVPAIEKTFTIDSGSNCRLFGKGLPIALRVPLSPRSPNRKGRKYSSESDDSFTMSQNDTASDISDGEGLIVALKEQLYARRVEADKLRKEKKRLHREKLASQEMSLKKQIASYDSYIQQAKTEIENSLREIQSGTPVKPVIKKPQVAEIKKLKRDIVVAGPQRPESSDLCQTCEATKEVDISLVSRSQVDILECHLSEKRETDSGMLAASLENNKVSPDVTDECTEHPKEVMYDDDIAATDVSSTKPSPKKSISHESSFESDFTQDLSPSQASSTETIIQSPKKLDGSQKESEQDSQQSFTDRRSTHSEKSLSSAELAIEEYIHSSSGVENDNILNTTVILKKGSSDDDAFDVPQKLAGVIQPVKCTESTVEISGYKSEQDILVAVTDFQTRANIAKENVLTKITDALFASLLLDATHWSIDIVKKKMVTESSFVQSKQGFDEINLQRDSDVVDIVDRSSLSVHADDDTVCKNKCQILKKVNDLISENEASALGGITLSSTAYIHPKLTFDLSPDLLSPMQQADVSPKVQKGLEVSALSEPPQSDLADEIAPDEKDSSSPAERDNYTLDVNLLSSKLLSLTLDEEPPPPSEEFSIQGLEGSWFDDDFWLSVDAKKQQELKEEGNKIVAEIVQIANNHLLTDDRCHDKPPPPYTPPGTVLGAVPPHHISASEQGPFVSVVNHSQLLGGYHTHRLSKMDLQQFAFRDVHVVPSQEHVVLDIVQKSIRELLPVFLEGRDPSFVKDLPTDFCVHKKKQSEGYNKHAEDSFNLLLFNLVTEILSELHILRTTPPPPPWLHLQFPPVRLLKAQRNVESHILQTVKILFGWQSPVQKQTLMVKWAKKKRDMVDQILVQELQQEEASWTNYEQDEAYVKNQLSEEIFDSLIQETVEVFLQIISDKLRTSV